MSKKITFHFSNGSNLMIDNIIESEATEDGLAVETPGKSIVIQSANLLYTVIEEVDDA